MATALSWALPSSGAHWQLWHSPCRNGHLQLGCRFVTSPGKSPGRAAGRAGGVQELTAAPWCGSCWWEPLLLQQQDGGSTESLSCGVWGTLHCSVTQQCVEMGMGFVPVWQLPQALCCSQLSCEAGGEPWVQSSGSATLPVPAGACFVPLEACSHCATGI